MHIFEGCKLDLRFSTDDGRSWMPTGLSELNSQFTFASAEDRNTKGWFVVSSRETVMRKVLGKEGFTEVKGIP